MKRQLAPEAAECPWRQLRWAQVKAIFYAALEQPPTDRRTYLIRACENDDELQCEIESLLSSHNDADDFIELPAIAPPTLHTVATADSGGARIGPYTLLCGIGHGGMGEVYLAVRDDDSYNQQVAIKVIRSGFGSDAIISRCRHERQIISACAARATTVTRAASRLEGW